MTEHEQSASGYLQEVSRRVAEEFGEEALFEYPASSGESILTFAEAVVISGSHMVDVPIDVLLDMLEAWRTAEPSDNANLEDRELFKQKRERGQKIFARYVLAQKG